MQIITKILDYLPFNDRKNFALLNTKWYHASLHPLLIKKDWFIYDPTNVGDVEEFIKCLNDFKQLLIKSKRTFFNLKLYFIHDISDPTIFEGLGNRVLSLHLINLTYFDDCFLDFVTDGCNILESLTIEKTKIMILNYKPRKLLLNLRILTLKNVYLSDKNFNIIMQCCPNLENIGLKQCNILEWVPVLKKFYSDWENCQVFNSEDVFSYHSVVNCLNTTKNLNNLRLQNCKIFTYLPTHIKLKNLTLKSTRPMYFGQEKLIDLEKLALALGKHVLLNQLKIKYLPCCLLSAVSKLQNLKRLKVHFTTNSSQRCNVNRLCIQRFVESLSNMKELKELSIIPWNQEQILCSIPAIPDCTLSLLTSLDCFIENRQQIVHFSNNLKYLRIQNGDILTPSDLHLIFNNFINLRHLYIDNCIILDDSIFEELPISNLKGKNDQKRLKMLTRYQYFNFIFRFNYITY